MTPCCAISSRSLGPEVSVRERERERKRRGRERERAREKKRGGGRERERERKREGERERERKREGGWRVWLKDKPPQSTTNHHKPPQTTTNHHKPPQTTTHHRKPPQTTTRIWDDNTSVWPCAVKKRLNHRKPPQTTTNHLQNLGLICIHVLVKSKYLLNYNRFSNSTINVFVQFVFRLFLRPLLELAITQHVAPPCDQSHCSLP